MYRYRNVYCGACEIKMCAWQVRVPGFEFIGCGEARSKKEAQGIAAKMFCQFLVEQGLIDASTLPAPLDGVSQTLLVAYCCQPLPLQPVCRLCMM